MIQRLRRDNPAAGVPANPGASSAVTLFDDLGDTALMQNSAIRAQVVAYLDQNFTLKSWWAKSATGALHLRSSVDVAPGGSHPSAAITCVAVASLANNDRFAVTVSNATGETTTTVTFEYKVSAPFTPVAGRVTIDVSELTTDVEVAVASAAAVLAAFAGLVAAPEPTTATFTVTHVSTGAHFTCSAAETVTNAGFSVTNTAGTDGTGKEWNVRLLPGRNKITLHTGTAPTEFDVAVETTDDATGV